MTLQLNAPILPNGERMPTLSILTNDVYECGNSSVEMNHNLDGNLLTMKVLGIRIASPCKGPMGLAKGTVDLSSFPLGEYRVRITINRQVFKAALLVDSTHLKLDVIHADDRLLRIYNPRLNLIPKSTIWGKCEYSDSMAIDKAQQLFSQLEQLGAKKSQLPIGKYEDFYLHEVGTTQPKTLAANRFEFPFVYHYSGSLSPLQEILNGFRSDLKVTLKTCKGDVIRNF